MVEPISTLRGPMLPSSGWHRNGEVSSTRCSTSSSCCRVPARRGGDARRPPGAIAGPIAEARPVRAGHELGKYRLERVLGAGGMGVVWASARRRSRSRGRAQGVEPGARRRWCRARADGPRGSRDGAARSPERDHRVRCRDDRRSRPDRDGADRRRDHGELARARPAARRWSIATLARGRSRPRGRARRGHGPPRLQTSQRARRSRAAASWSPTSASCAPSVRRACARARHRDPGRARDAADRDRAR